ncbi:MAG: DUF1273 domain-containing protein [Firmicutes bacterium]|nr:DUF1273 domain-containing protein [Bacillota bacterium]
MNICFFIGHREATQEIYPAVFAAVQRAYESHSCTTFVVGQYSGFDRIAAKAVKELRKTHPEVRLLLLLPYHPAERRVECPEGFDATYYPEGMESVPRRLAIVRANRSMVDCSRVLISYVWHPASNSMPLLGYARRRQARGLLTLIELGQPDARRSPRE